MNYSIHPIRELDPTRIPELAQIHMWDHGLLTSLGYPFVRRYFEIVFQDEKVLGVVAQSESGELIGYNIASPDPASLTSRLTSPLAPFLKQLIVVLFTRPLALVQLVVSSLVIKTQMNNETDAIESLFLTVDPAYQGQGIGRNLQQALIKEARNSGYKRILGSVETWNTASIRMCHSNGFTIKNTFREGLKKRHRIEKIL